MSGGVSVWRVVIWLVLSLVLGLSGGGSALKICTFNIQSFGEKKIEKQEVVGVILALIARCDIMLVMEIKDLSGKAFPQLMTQLNSDYSSRKNEYNYVISDRLGRKSYKEQYAFIYRQRLVSVKEVYQYPDTQLGDEDAFSREPFIVWFSSPKTVVQDFVIIPIHTTPDTSVREINELYDVFQDVKQRWTSKNVIIMGDFNADCGYVPKKQWSSIRLRSDTSFLWLTGDTIDTTVKESTDCAYDRVVLHGDKMIQAVKPTSLDVFDFRQAYGLTELQALAVSDHYPVCITVNAAPRNRG
ncbi:deoxyribonuclease gamma [Salmo salar]|uniref:Deoxyribonuclease n=1 Tax=Salmo salar TaxID=8030 RepID=A0A1S3P8I8_SALSA|nr:deoxyribonuclease gamma [Salmo salar]|eukprot:XP_014023882.1 PREDICTED: LOW QUALITY PROTEIN: deoxyribonuclease gamma [Salmo salar]